MSRIKKKLNELSGGKFSTWSQEANFRLKNKKWLRYSSNIARRILAAIEDNQDMTQKSLAKLVGVTPQYISKVLKGHENLSLETIGKLSDALGFELVSFPPYKFSESLVLLSSTATILTLQTTIKPVCKMPDYQVSKSNPINTGYINVRSNDPNRPADKINNSRKSGALHIAV